MPKLTRWMLKTSLIYLLLALLIGLARGLQPFFAGSPAFLRQLEPVRVHLFVVGWLSMLIFGVVFWMFPKFSQEKPRGHEWLLWAAYDLINLGLILRIIGESAAQPGSFYGWLLVASAGLQWLASLAFVIHTWPRIREK